MATDTPHPAALLALVAAVAVCAGPPILLADLDPAPAVALAALVAGSAAAVVVAVARDGTFGPAARDRYRRTAVALTVLAFTLTAVLTPPDPLTQLLVGLPAVAGSLLLALVAVAYDLDERRPLPW